MYILDYLRNDLKMPVLDDKYTQSLLRIEMDFWGLTPPKVIDEYVHMLQTKVFDVQAPEFSDILR